MSPTVRTLQIERAQAHLPRTSSVSAATIIKMAEANALRWRDAFALVEGESGFHNIFGHDAGGMWAGRRVTRWKVAVMIAAVKRGHVSNGVGVTQLTSLDFLLAAQRSGGAHLVEPQLLVAFGLLSRLQRKHGHRGGFAAYNGGEGGMSFPGPQAYADHMTIRAERWLRVFHGH
jgi:hypothetical protein